MKAKKTAASLARREGRKAAPATPKAAKAGSLGTKAGGDERFRAVHAEVLALCERERAARYRIGEKLSLVRRERLFLLGGHASFAAYLQSLRGPSLRTLWRYLRLADQVPRDVAERWASERIELALRLLPARKGQTVISAAAFEKLKVTVERKGKPVMVLFVDASTEELELAVLAHERRRLPAPSTETVASSKRLGEKFGLGATGLADVRVARRFGQEVVVITVPADRLARFEKLIR